MAQGKTPTEGTDATPEEAPERVHMAILFAHEVITMTDFPVRAIDEELVKHVVVRDRPEWVAMCEEAKEPLRRLHTAIARENFVKNMGETHPSEEFGLR